ncbi:MAG TPA: polysaccharide ABC transporter ATP-binding protein [Candidatus Dormibacteraeota bacterium]|nr:polysaccharide ABC transporter ATP-binding protein [Candidatus Dormibacteraeota bacterium]
MSDDNIAIKVEGVGKTFRLPHEKNNSIKSAVINFYKRKRTFEKQVALQDISFEVKKGEFFGIVGRNGSGKSTLLKLLAGIYHPGKGTININGTLTPFIELGVGFSPELTGRENVFLNGALLGFNRSEMEAMYDDIVAFAEIERFMDQKLKNYSSGMQVRLAFSIAIRAKGDILLLDEVLAVGDAAFQQKCYNYFEELKKRKQTVVFVSHDMGAVRRFCTQALLIEDGEIKKSGTPDDVAGQYTLDNIATTEKQTFAEKEKNQKLDTKLVKSLSIKMRSPVSLGLQDQLVFDIKYKLNKPFDVVLGYTISKQGVSVAEMNSKKLKLDNKVNTEHVLTHKTGVEAFNAGAYVIDIAIFDRKGMEIVGYSLNCAQFVIGENDKTKGGIIRVEGEWDQ